MDKSIYIVVTPFFPSPMSWRGSYCLDFVKALERALEAQGKNHGNRWEVLVFKEGDGGDYVVEGVTVHTFKARRLPSNIFPNLFGRFNQRSFLKKVGSVLGSAYNIRLSTCFESVEICHVHTANFGIYAEAMKKANPNCKTLLHHHDLQSFGLNMGVLRHCWLYNMILFPIMRRMHEQIDTHVFISEVSRSSFLSAPDTSWTQYADYKKQMRGLGCLRSVRGVRSVILHNGVDKLIFYPSTARTQQEAKTFTIGCVGNFSELKGQDALIKAMGCVAEAKNKRQCEDEKRKVRVVFVGSGQTLEVCKKLAKEIEDKYSGSSLSICFTFRPEVGHKDLADFYRTLDLFVLPSWFEGFGCVFMEAHACGVPFITCEGQGVGDVLEKMVVEGRESSPWLCKQRDPEDLAKKIGAYMDRVAHGEREEQRLLEDLDIDTIVGRFVEEIGL